MKRIIFAAALAALTGLPAVAQDTSKEDAPAALAAPGPRPASTVLALADVNNVPGEKLPPGDFIVLTRLFQAWTTTCQYRLEPGRRVCFVQQVLNDKDGRPAATWRIGPTTAGQNAVQITLLGSKPVADSFVMKSEDNMMRAIPAAQWKCGASECTTMFMYTRSFLETFMTQNTVRISFKRAEAEAPVELTATLLGFSAAADSTLEQNDLLLKRNLAQARAANPKPDAKAPVEAAARTAARKVP
jgi:invasion protein IalB